ncbi:metalloregulator ArsR/SmtB family transcription factor [Leifsonia aquatica]|uniref:metalloregulator ArsR/SmtB family transcription factor n=1 Tax=Leifsonia aquatica TaxID=144185 RepID=UPI0004A7BEEB|nr:metalloregulator ArsR/SmtB family transcription factor [Leifsonia aquatica]
MDAWNTEVVDKLAVYDSLAVVMKAVANGRRLELIEVLAQGEHSVEVLSRMTGMGLTTVSAGLQILKQAGLVRTRREGTTVHYRLAGTDVIDLYLAAKRVGLLRLPELRDTLAAYMDQAAPSASSVPLIDPAAVTSTMTVVDVRPLEEFEAGHFPGAMSIPLAELEDRGAEVPTDAEVVVYCRGEFCRMAREAAAWMRDRGINAKAMDEGVIEWRASEEGCLDQTA